MSENANGQTVFDLPEKNIRANALIEQFATAHGYMDVGIGLLGFLPYPGAGPASIAAATLAQVPVYVILANKLAGIYNPSPSPMKKRHVRRQVAVSGGLEFGASVGVHALDALADTVCSQAWMDLVQEVGAEVAKETTLGMVLSAVPVVGGVVSTALDYMIATTMTWRVGTMVSMYYQNGGQWIGDRKQTHKRAKKWTGRLSPKNKGRVDLNAVGFKDEKLAERQLVAFVKQVKLMLSIDPGLTDERLRELLIIKRVPGDFVDRVIKKARE